MKKSPMTAEAFWNALSKSVEAGWDAQELHNLLAYYLRKDLNVQDQAPDQIVKAYREWYDTPTNANDLTLPAHERRVAHDKELWELVMSFKTIPAFKETIKQLKKESQ